MYHSLVAESDLGSKYFSRYSWSVLAYTILVIAWGAFVRASGSGAGCGEHWPLCNGVIVPRSPGLETIVELSHRLTSGLTLIAVAIMAIWAFRKFPKGHALRQGSVLTGIFLVLEAGVGAGLVLAALVKDNASILRAAPARAAGASPCLLPMKAFSAVRPSLRNSAIEALETLALGPRSHSMGRA